MQIRYHFKNAIIHEDTTENPTVDYKYQWNSIAVAVSLQAKTIKETNKNTWAYVQIEHCHSSLSKNHNKDTTMMVVF